VLDPLALVHKAVGAMRAARRLSGTIAGVFPSVPQDGDRDPWGDDVSRELARSSPRAAAGVYGAVPDGDADPARHNRPADFEEPEAEEEDQEHEIEAVPVRRQLSVAIAGFAALLAAGLILGAQTSGPDARAPYAIVIFGVQVLFVLAWTMAMRPPGPILVAGVALAAGAVADYTAVRTGTPRVLPLLYVCLAAAALIVIGQFVLRVDRLRVRDAFGSTFLIVFGVVAFASLITLTRKPVGTQAVLVCLTAAGVALLTARLIDAVFPRPRIAPQVARGATGIIVGAMLGTLVAAGLGSVLVLPFTPAKGAILGVVAAGLAVLADLAVNFTEAGRGLFGQAPTFWLARHMQGPLGSFALAAPVAYVLTVFVLS
jgi:hypothetical protein